MASIIVLNRPDILASPSTPVASGTPDPTQLPLATGQSPLYSAYSALGVQSLAAGSSYLDPLTGVRIWKVTSSTVPDANSGCTHGYAEYGPFVSRAWGASLKHTILFATAADEKWLVDFERGVGLSNYRQITGTIKPDGDTGWCWSNVIGTEQIGYAFNNSGGTLRMVNTAPASPVEVVSGFFPKAGFGTSFVAPQVMQDKNDIWFVGGNSSSGGTQHAFNASTGGYITQSPSPGGNDTRILRGDSAIAYFQLTDGSYSIWDLNTNTVLGNYGFNTLGSHPGALRKYFVDGDGAAAAPYRLQYVDVTVTPPVASYLTSPGSFSHSNGCWIQTDADLGGDLTKQWMLGDHDETYGAGQAWDHSIGYARLSDSSKRVLCHHYSDDSIYAGRPFASASPDGRVVIFASRMMTPTSSGRYDEFIVEVPLAT